MRSVCRVNLISCTRILNRSQPRTKQYINHNWKRAHTQTTRLPRTGSIPIRPQAQKSGAYPITFLVAIALGVAAGFIYDSAAEPAPPKIAENETSHLPASLSVDSISIIPDPSVPDMPDTVQPGRPGNLTSEQEARLKEMWLAVLDIFGVHKENPNGASASSSAMLSADSPDQGKGKKKSRLSWLGKGKNGADGADGEGEDKHGQTKEFKLALASQSPESLRAAFWSMVKHDDPDALMLRFLRARKWEVHDAVVMLISTMHWRSQEMHVDDEIMYKGEGGYSRAAKTASGSEKKDAEDFMAILRKGLSFLHGTDNEGRPVTIVRARTHHPNEQTEKAVEQYTVYVIETARMLLRHPVDTATIVFDMTGFSMSNMDYTPVKFMIKCFEANYPESLGSVLVYKAPWIFQGIWKIIKGWLDPVVASKVHFASDEAELSHYIPKSRILKELGGDDAYQYKYIDPPAGGEDQMMQDKSARDRIESERKGMVQSYEKETVSWAKASSAAEAKSEMEAREKLKEQLRNNYWTLDPYVRARGLYDRIGMIGPGGKLDFYPTKRNSADRAGAVHTSADDLD